MLSKDLFISMKEIRVNIISLERDSGPTALGTKPRSATTETPVAKVPHARPSLKKG
jgi:hypothetical protein